MLARHSQGKICSTAAFLRIQRLQCKLHLPGFTANPQLEGFIAYAGDALVIT